MIQFIFMQYSPFPDDSIIELLQSLRCPPTHQVSISGIRNSKGERRNELLKKYLELFDDNSFRAALDPAGMEAPDTLAMKRHIEGLLSLVDGRTSSLSSYYTVKILGRYYSTTHDPSILDSIQQRLKSKHGSTTKEAMVDVLLTTQDPMERGVRLLSVVFQRHEPSIRQKAVKGLVSLLRKSQGANRVESIFFKNVPGRNILIFHHLLTCRIDGLSSLIVKIGVVAPAQTAHALQSMNERFPPLSPARKQQVVSNLVVTCKSLGTLRKKNPEAFKVLWSGYQNAAEKIRRQTKLPEVRSDLERLEELLARNHPSKTDTQRTKTSQACAKASPSSER